MANGLIHSMTCFGHIVSFIWAKEMLEPMRSLVTALQGRHVEEFFGLLISSYTGRNTQSDLLVCTWKLISSTTDGIDWRTSACLQQTKTSWKPTSRVRCTILEANSSNILPWRHFLGAQKSLQQRKEDTLQAMHSNSSGHRCKVWISHDGTWSNT